MQRIATFFPIFVYHVKLLFFFFHVSFNEMRALKTIFLSTLRSVSLSLPSTLLHGSLTVEFAEWKTFSCLFFAAKAENEKFYELSCFVKNNNIGLINNSFPGFVSIYFGCFRKNCENIKVYNPFSLSGMLEVHLASRRHESSSVSDDAKTFFPHEMFSFTEVPMNPPVIHGIRSRYKLNDIVRGNCTSKHSRPAVNLTWTINDIIVSETVFVSL